MKLPKAIEEVINNFERLPGIGPKSAGRLAFYLLNVPQDYNQQFGEVLINLKKKVKICRQCFSVTEKEICEICSDVGRNKFQICVVERALDIVAFESVGGYKGVYHVLGGVINPLEHVGPEELKIGELIERLEKLDEKVEIIMATNLTMEGEATALYIKNKIEKMNNKNGILITRIGSGLPMGADLGYADQATLSRAMDGRREI